MADRDGKQKLKTKKKKSRPNKPVTYTKPSIRKDKNLINKYHALKKIEEAIKKDTSLSNVDKSRKLLQLSSKMEKLGGLEAYQKASRLGETRNGGFNSAKWVLKQLKVHNIRPTSGDNKLKLLDVGALDSNYRKQTWIDCTSIDLNPQSRSVIKADFLKLDSSKTKYDIVVLSLVINFEGNPNRRGDMLTFCTKIISRNGYLFVVLPLPCIENSRFFSEELFIAMSGSLGFDMVAKHSSRRLYFAMLKKTGSVKPTSFPRKTLRAGDGHNNFAIIL